MPRRSLVLAVAGLVATVAPAMAADEMLSGSFALAGGEATVEGHLAVTETAPLSLELELTYTDAGIGEPVTAFTEELTQQLHLLAVDSSLTHLVHEHVKAATADGRFATGMQVPRPGLYHIYADAVPEGRGQQVVRFDVQVGEAAADIAPAPQPFALDALIAVPIGDYEVTIDAREAQPYVEGAWHIAISKAGQPATDLSPYLGVAAHAILIRAADLSYVHAHPTEGGADTGHDAHASGHAHAPAPAENAHAGHAAPASVAPEMTLHLTPPGAGRYTLFLEFIGGGEIQTLAVPLEWPAS
ncbi:MAG: hypothetical protein EOP22_03980 [Hyphomicrobiales bacterium]|nr:MAG: hypothetical protein EOP22_03980 [Hyphomicrobiales bacterium]